ncbi:hypothetical protein B0T11DRAFT_287694 [Plectosphaerella cucumerina]|uniref:Uncharacterized protein n=1 Tax=Plectosphaerella cucumerina TaxID=40658 RepID=A0A8K0TEG7_9PEZI|nr:hypothetical protein B0T11DRAFT_287694 [Plectosphaerella cucumerina]
MDVDRDEPAPCLRLPLVRETAPCLPVSAPLFPRPRLRNRLHFRPGVARPELVFDRPPAISFTRRCSTALPPPQLQFVSSLRYRFNDCTRLRPDDSTRLGPPSSVHLLNPQHTAASSPRRTFTASRHGRVAMVRYFPKLDTCTWGTLANTRDATVSPDFSPSELNLAPPRGSPCQGSRYLPACSRLTKIRKPDRWKIRVVNSMRKPRCSPCMLCRSGVRLSNSSDEQATACLPSLKLQQGVANRPLSATAGFPSPGMLHAQALSLDGQPRVADVSQTHNAGRREASPFAASHRLRHGRGWLAWVRATVGAEGGRPWRVCNLTWEVLT